MIDLWLIRVALIIVGVVALSMLIGTWLQIALLIYEHRMKKRREGGWEE